MTDRLRRHHVEKCGLRPRNKQLKINPIEYVICTKTSAMITTGHNRAGGTRSSYQVSTSKTPGTFIPPLPNSPKTLARIRDTERIRVSPDRDSNISPGCQRDRMNYWAKRALRFLYLDPQFQFIHLAPATGPTKKFNHRQGARNLCFFLLRLWIGNTPWISIIITFIQSV